MPEAKKSQLPIIPKGEYEVLVESIELRVARLGTPYALCRCVISDEGPFRDRVLFYTYTRPQRGLPRGHVEFRAWKPRYGILRLDHNNKNGHIYPHPDRLVLI